MNSDGRRHGRVVVRSLRTDDRVRFDRLWERLSAETIFRRFHSPVPRLPESMRRHLLTVDHRDREVLVALVDGEMIAMAHCFLWPGKQVGAEVAVVVEDAWQNRGIGRRLLLDLAALATERGVRAITGEVQSDNRRVLHLIDVLAPDHTLTREGPTCHVCALPRPASAAS